VDDDFPEDFVACDDPVETVMDVGVVPLAVHLRKRTMRLKGKIHSIG